MPTSIPCTIFHPFTCTHSPKSTHSLFSLLSSFFFFVFSISRSFQLTFLAVLCLVFLCLSFLFGSRKTFCYLGGVKRRNNCWWVFGRFRFLVRLWSVRIGIGVVRIGVIRIGIGVATRARVRSRSWTQSWARSFGWLWRSLSWYGVSWGRQSGFVCQIPVETIGGLNHRHVEIPRTSIGFCSYLWS